MNETLLTIVGNVVESPEWRVFNSGTSKATFRMAATERRFDRDTGKWTDGDSLFMTVSCWRQLADNVHESLHRGDPVMVSGRLVTDNFEVDGQRRSKTYVEATAVGHDLSRGVADFRRTSRRGPAAVPAAAPMHRSAPAGVDPISPVAPVSEVPTSEVAMGTATADDSPPEAGAA